MAQPFWGGASAEGENFSLDPWDVVFIGGDPLPGICEVKGIAQLEVDKKKAKGSHGSTITVTGYLPSPFEVTVTVWTEDQKDFLEAWITKFWINPQKEPPKPKGQPQVSLALDHPACAMLGIDTCIVLGISMLEDGSFEGSKVIRIKLMDGRVTEKKNVTKTAEGSRNNVPIDKALQEKQKSAVPPKPSAERADLGPKGPRPKPASGSD